MALLHSLGSSVPEVKVKSGTHTFVTEQNVGTARHSGCWLSLQLPLRVSTTLNLPKFHPVFRVLAAGCLHAGVS